METYCTDYDWDVQDRIDSLSSRAIKWSSLARKRNAEKKLAVTVFSFPPDKGNVGTAAYLNVFGSIYRVLKVPTSLYVHLPSVCL